MTAMPAMPPLPGPTPGLPCDADGPVFGAPWQAQAFAMAVALHRQGLFSWPEWAAALAQRIRTAPAAEHEDAQAAYYRQWLAALEDLVADKGASSAEQLQRYQRAWDRAAQRTPHGQAVELRASDFDPVAGGSIAPK